MAFKDTLQKSLKELAHERDELRLQMHLASMEARDSWDELEHKWENLELKLQKAGDQASQMGENVETAIDLITEEIKSGYQKIRKSLH